MAKQYACVGGPLNGHIVTVSDGNFFVAAIRDRNNKGKVRNRQVTYNFARGNVGGLQWLYLKYAGACNGQ